MRSLISSILSEAQREKFRRDLELDFAYSLPGVARFRANIYQQRNSLGAAFRIISQRILSVPELGLPPVVNKFSEIPRGLVLVTGTTGSGKSTTLAALVDKINQEKRMHIVTIEDPIEFLHHHKRSIVNQREVGVDTHTFSEALRHVLRQDPDVIVIGELRDLESTQMALTAAETGHLVFGSMHTQDAAQTVDRILDMFPPEQQNQVRSQLSTTLRAVISQTLVPKIDGKGRVLAAEIMVTNSALSHLIREGKSHQMYSVLQAGAAQGMQTLDQSLANLVNQEVIDYDEGRGRSSDVKNFDALVSTRFARRRYDDLNEFEYNFRASGPNPRVTPQQG